jgi:hypothetical protein
MWRTQSLILGIATALNPVAHHRAWGQAVGNSVAFDRLSVEDVPIRFSL